jgi:arsenate reductase (thioredoxin)
VKPRVLFVCLGNACRSQMAEGFLRAWAGTLLEVESAGLMPLGEVPEETRAAMAEIGIPIETHTSKGIEVFRLQTFDVVVNMSGLPLPRPFAEGAREWKVADPYMRGEQSYRRVRDEIGERVKVLLAELRGETPPPPPGLLERLFKRKS